MTAATKLVPCGSCWCKHCTKRRAEREGDDIAAALLGFVQHLATTQEPNR